ncbi:MAG: hypothetical protein GY861_22385 [bacterium]|nr:hypothetical protein [bacterium]
MNGDGLSYKDTSIKMAPHFRCPGCGREMVGTTLSFLRGIGMVYGIDCKYCGFNRDMDQPAYDYLLEEYEMEKTLSDLKEPVMSLSKIRNFTDIESDALEKLESTMQAYLLAQSRSFDYKELAWSSKDCQDCFEVNEAMLAWLSTDMTTQSIFDIATKLLEELSISVYETVLCNIISLIVGSVKKGNDGKVEGFVDDTTINTNGLYDDRIINRCPYIYSLVNKDKDFVIISPEGREDEVAQLIDDCDEDTSRIKYYTYDEMFFGENFDKSRRVWFVFEPKKSFYFKLRDNNPYLKIKSVEEDRMGIEVGINVMFGIVDKSLMEMYEVV